MSNQCASVDVNPDPCPQFFATSSSQDFRSPFRFSERSFHSSVSWDTVHEVDVAKSNEGNAFRTSNAVKVPIRSVGVIPVWHIEDVSEFESLYDAKFSSEHRRPKLSKMN